MWFRQNKQVKTYYTRILVPIPTVLLEAVLAKDNFGEGTDMFQIA